ncbi:unnamed protein product, partial [Thlaspi arvense]
MDKSKGPAPSEDSDSDRDGDINTQRIPTYQRSVSAVRRRRLFYDSDKDDEPEENVDVQDTSTYNSWGKSEESQHAMMIDYISDPILFARDAPPVYPMAHHIACAVHLWRNRLANIVKDAARAYTISEFNK